MAVSVFPERMNKLDPEDVSASLRTIEDYIGYITERTEYALTNTFRTSSGLGTASQEISVTLQETVDSLAALNGQVEGVSGSVTWLQGDVFDIQGSLADVQDTLGGIRGTISQIQGDITSGLAEKVDKVDGMGLSANDYTTAEKTKLANIAAGAEVNQNAFSSVKVGSTFVTADTETDTLALAAGTNVTLVADASTNTITIAADPTAAADVTGLLSGQTVIRAGEDMNSIVEPGSYMSYSTAAARQILHTPEADVTTGLNGSILSFLVMVIRWGGSKTRSQILMSLNGPIYSRYTADATAANPVWTAWTQR